MGGRTKPNWVYYSGGPLDGKRELLAPQLDGMTVLSRAPGVPGLHEYKPTQEYRCKDMEGGMKLGHARVIVYTRTVDE